MTTGNDPALPPVQDQTTPPAPTNEPPAPGLTFTAAPEIIDPDDVALNAAKAEVQAEKASDGAAPGADATTGQDPATPPAAAAATTDQNKPGQQPAPVMIPKPRFDELAADRDKAKQEAAYWQGVAKAREPAAPGQPGQQPPAAAEPTPEQKLTAIHAAQDALATRFDNGEITRAEEVKQRRALDDQEATLREEALTAKLKPQAPAENSDALYLDTLTADLENTHLWVKPFDAVATKTEWNFVESKARENLAERGVAVKGTIGSYELRKEISSVIDKFGPSLIADRLDQVTAKGLTIPGAQPSQPAAPPMSAEAKARLAKLGTRAGAPPDIAAMTGHNAGSPGAAPTDTAIESMSEADYDKLPASTRNKLLGITA